MFTLTFETIPHRFGGSDKVRFIITDSNDDKFPIIVWVGETFVYEVAAVSRLKRMAKKALKEFQNEAA